jgi:hypothetical protein
MLLRAMPMPTLTDDPEDFPFRLVDAVARFALVFASVVGGGVGNGQRCTQQHRPAHA